MMALTDASSFGGKDDGNERKRSFSWAKLKFVLSPFGFLWWSSNFQLHSVSIQVDSKKG